MNNKNVKQINGQINLSYLLSYEGLSILIIYHFLCQIYH